MRSTLIHLLNQSAKISWRIQTTTMSNISDIITKNSILRINQKMDIKMKSIFSSHVFLILLLFSTLIEAQWHKQTNGLPDTWSLGWAMDAIDSNNAIISTGVGLFKTNDGGNLWLEILLPDSITETIIDVSMNEALHCWLATDLGKIIATTDGGQSWIVQFDDTSKTNFMNYIEMFDSQNGVAMGDGAIISPTYAPGPALFLRTTDGGANWVSVNDSAFGGISGDTWRRLDFSDPMHGYFYESGINPQKLYKTSNGCVNWVETNYSNSATVIKCFDENIILAQSIICNPVCVSTISKTMDGGNTWRETQLGDRWGNDFEFIPGDASKVFFTDGDNLFFSNDTGSTWEAVFVDTSALDGRDIVFTDKNTGWILGDNGNVYKTTTGGIPTDVDEIDFLVPDQYSLSQNFPNPFNPSTTISYQLPINNKVTLKIYDILGNEIATLVNDEKVADNYEVAFNAKHLSSGVYFYQLKAGEFISTKKMILIK
jgi:photosystem II stability/assembly factor-like uncharacterized protein